MPWVSDITRDITSGITSGITPDTNIYLHDCAGNIVRDCDNLKIRPL